MLNHRRPQSAGLRLTCTGRLGRSGYTLEQAAQMLLDCGASDAPLMDEGAVVFRRLGSDDGRLADVLPRIRRRVRATLIAVPREGLVGDKA